MKSPRLTIVIAVRNEPQNLVDTIATIRHTSPLEEVEIIVCDDASDPPFDPCLIDPRLAIDRVTKSRRSFLRFFQWPTRHGHAYCRNYGAVNAAGEWLMFTDAHMVFPKGWWETLWSHIGEPGDRNLYCGSYVSLSPATDRITPDVKLDAIFGGARFYYYELKPDRTLDVIGMEFLPEQNGHKAVEIPCVVGASYFIRRERFLDICGLQGLSGWSTDEWLLSVKTWLSGGRVMLLPDVTIGHVNFKGVPGNTSRDMARAHMLYNKLVMAFTTMPAEDFDPFARYLPRTDPAVTLALARLDENRHKLITLRDLTLATFKRDVLWLCGKFNIAHPSDLGAEDYALS